jgi:hypothetical protein
MPREFREKIKMKYFFNLASVSQTSRNNIRSNKLAILVDTVLFCLPFSAYPVLPVALYLSCYACPVLPVLYVMAIKIF